jgi:hydroxymethylpyrimidine pyrophosphatase-like HAD family hydrolase
MAVLPSSVTSMAFDTRPVPGRALATDYDGTLATEGVVDAQTEAALVELRRAGWKLLVVTGRRLDTLQAAFPRLDLCDLVVAEDGALLAWPDGRVRVLAPPPPPPFLEELRRRSVPFSMGRVIVNTTVEHRGAVEDALALSSANLWLSFNKGALMVLPAGVDKASGLLTALAELGVSPETTVGAGDAENDLPFLRVCGVAVACGDALPEVRAAAGRYTPSVRALIGELLSA